MLIFNRGVTTPLLLGAGTAAAPALALGDSATGFFQLDTANIGVSVAGATPFMLFGANGVDNGLWLGSTGMFGWDTIPNPGTGSPGLRFSLAAANIVKISSGAAACQMRIHGSAGEYATVRHTGSLAVFGFKTSDNLIMDASNTYSQCQFLASVDNSYDLGDATHAWKLIVAKTGILSGTNPSSTGAFRVGSQGSLKSRNAANSADLSMIYSDTVDNLMVGGSSESVWLQPQGSALATAATKGFVGIPSCAGTPTGVPANMSTGCIPMIYDTTNNKFYFYNGGWKRAQVAAVDAIYA